MKNSCNIILDLSGNVSDYPNFFKKIYDKNTLRKKKIYIKWIDEISKNYKKDILWWSLGHVSKNNYLNKIYHFFILLETLNELKGSKKFDTLIVDKILKENIAKINFQYKKKIITKKKIHYKNNFFQIFKFFLYEFFTILALKFISKTNYKKKKLFLVDGFITSAGNPSSGFFENIKSSKIYNRNFVFVPTFAYLNYFVCFRLNLRLAKSKNYLLKEHYLEFKDLFSAMNIIKYAYFFDFKLIKFGKWQFKNILMSEMKNFSQFDGILICILNFLFAKNLKKNQIKLSKTINFFENQNIDKGWNLGFNTFYNKDINIGYQAFTYMPESFNISPSKLEILSGVCPKKIIIKGKGFKKIISENYNKIIFSIGPSFKKFNKKYFNANKKIDYLFLLTGIPNEDQKIINEMLTFKIMNKNKKIAVKFHPISKISNIDIIKIKNISISILEGNIAKHLVKSNIVVTAGLTTSLIEALIYNCKLIICSKLISDKLFFKNLKIPSKSYIFIGSILKKSNLNLSPLKIAEKNYLIKNFFADKYEETIKNLIR